MKRILLYLLWIFMFLSNGVLAWNPNQAVIDYLNNTPEGQEIVKKANEITDEYNNKKYSEENKVPQQWSAASEVGINFNWDCLMWMWKWCFDYEKVIWIDEAQNPNITATSITQDVILSATYMVWTVLTIVIIWCGLWYIFASRDGKDVSKYKKWLISAAIWALLVRWAYAIVRLIQYIAQW